MDAKNDATLTDCKEEYFSCVRVVTDLFISCLCLTKVLTIATSWHTVSYEISETSTIVQKLLSPRYISANTLAELRLFSL
jgi:hypothetical protein